MGLDVIVAGHLCLDMIPDFQNEPGLGIGDIFKSGGLFNVGDLSMATGGAVSNTGIALKIFGCRVGFVAKVGEDNIGRSIIEFMEKNGDTQGIKIAPGEPSSYTVVLSPVGIDRMFLHCAGTNDTFGASDIDYGLVKQARLFHLGYPNLMRELYNHGGRELVNILKRVRDMGVTTSLDLSLPDPESPAGKADWRSILTAALPYVDIFCPSIEEAFLCMHPEEYRMKKKKDHGGDLLSLFSPAVFSNLAAEFLNLGVALTALKAGPAGWYFRAASRERLDGMESLAPEDSENWADREVWCPAFGIDKIASSTGAGDVSIAAFLTALMRKNSLVQCLKYANGAARQNLSRLDSTSGLTDWNELTRQIPSMDLETLELKDKAWMWVAETGIWEKN